MKIKNFFKNIFKEIIFNFGLFLIKKRDIIFDKNFNYSKLNLLESNILLNYKLKDLITTAGKRLGSNEDPYYYALKESLPLDEKKIFIKSFLKNIKSKVISPRTAAEAIGLFDSKTLSNYPEWALVLPWDDLLIEENYQTYLLKFIAKRKKLKKIYEITDKKNKDTIIYHDLAWKSHGEQFFNLFKSMSKEGFKDYNSVPVNLFKYNDIHRLSLSDDGNHRVRVAYVLGFETIPLRISRIIDICNVNNWPNVKNGLYNMDEAKKIFIDYFNYSGKGTYL